MIRLALALALLATPALAAKPKHAAPTPSPPPPSRMPCALKTDVLARLAEKYHETPAWIGKSEAADRAIMLTQTPDGATWTLIMLRQANGLSLACVLAIGTAGSGVATGSGT